MTKKRKTSSRRRYKPAPHRHSRSGSLLFFLLGVVLTFSVLSFFPRLVPDRMQAAIHHTTIQVQQWRQQYWPSPHIHPKTTKIRKKPATTRTRPAPTTKKPVAINRYLILYKATPDYDKLAISSTLLTLPKEKKTKLARQIFAELSRDEAKGKSPLPSGVRLRSVSFSGQRITLDLSKEIISGLANAGSSGEMLAVYGLVNTYLKNFPKFSEVQITVAGHPVKTLAGHIEINKPLTFFTDKG